MPGSVAPEWRLIPMLEGAYEASSDGQIRRARAGRGTQAGRVLRQHPHNAGYLQCGPWIDNRGFRYLVHRLVADAFLGPCPIGMEVNHRNLNKHDNRAVNLEYVTRSGNMLHRVSAGIGRGATNGRAMLDETKVRAIRERHVAGEGYKRLGAAYGVSWGTIRNIIKNRTWRWLA